MPQLDPKLAATGTAALTLGLAIGVAVTPDPTPQSTPLAEVAAHVEPQRSPQLDVAAYHAAIIAAKAGRNDLTDLLTTDVQPGAEVTASVNLELGARPQSVAYTGEASGRFETLSLQYEDHDDATAITLVARNTSTATLRLTALVQFSPPPPRGK